MSDAHSHTHSLTHSLTRSLTHSLACSLTHSLARSHTHSLALRQLCRCDGTCAWRGGRDGGGCGEFRVGRLCVSATPSGGQNCGMRSDVRVVAFAFFSVFRSWRVAVVPVFQSRFLFLPQHCPSHRQKTHCIFFFFFFFFFLLLALRSRSSNFLPSRALFSKPCRQQRCPSSTVAAEGTGLVPVNAKVSWRRSSRPRASRPRSASSAIQAPRATSRSSATRLSCTPRRPRARASSTARPSWTPSSLASRLPLRRRSKEADSAASDRGMTQQQTGRSRRLRAA